MQQAQVAFEYPRVYRLSIGWALFFGLGGLAITGAGGIGTWYFGSGHEVRGRNDGLMLVTVCVAFVALGLLLLTYLCRSRLVLYADRVELHDPFSVKQMPYDQIEGRRVIEAQNSPSALVIVERHTGRKLQITQIFRQDELFLDWVGSLPDLDERDRIASEKEIAGEIEPGMTPEGRMAALSQARKIATALIVVTISVAAWALLYPHPYELAVGSLVALPWVALFIAWRSNGLYRVDQKKNDAHPSVGIPFMMPGFILMLIVIRDMHVLGVQNAVLATICMDVLLCIGAAAVDPTLRTRFGMMLLIVALSAAYGFGASMALNAVLDRSATEVYRTKVIAQSISRGKSTTYYLLLEPWGSRNEPDRVSVGARLYRSITPGKSVCIAARHGALNIAWYTVGACN